jgi:hypothetical protein
MGCACEDGARDSFYGIIKNVMDRENTLQLMEKIKGKMPDALYQQTLKMIKAAPAENFVVLIKMQDGGEMGIGHDAFPQTKEWATAHIGRPLHFTMTQLPNRRGGGLSMDIHDLGAEGMDHER